MDIEVLRQSTAEDHAAVEGAIPLMGTDLVLEQYVAVLRRMHGVVCAWERLCERDGPRWMQPMLKERQRRALLEEDLRVLGSELRGSELPGSELPNGGGPRLPECASDADFLGAMYVMEGSRLGGLMIAKHVEGVLGLEAGRGDAYFRGGGGQTAAMWREVLEVLRTRVPDDETELVILAAQRMFRSVGEWMRGAVELPAGEAELPRMRNDRSQQR